jgi:hypothetical protein
LNQGRSCRHRDCIHANPPTACPSTTPIEELVCPCSLRINITQPKSATVHYQRRQPSPLFRSHRGRAAMLSWRLVASREPVLVIASARSPAVSETRDRRITIWPQWGAEGVYLCLLCTRQLIRSGCSLATSMVPLPTGRLCPRRLQPTFLSWMPFGTGAAS